MPVVIDGDSIKFEMEGTTHRFANVPDGVKNLVIMLVALRERNLTSKEEFAKITAKEATGVEALLVLEKIRGLLTPKATDKDWHARNFAAAAFEKFYAAITMTADFSKPISFNSGSCSPSQFRAGGHVRFIEAGKSAEEMQTANGNDFIFRLCMALGGVEFEQSKLYNPEARASLLTKVGNEVERTAALLQQMLRSARSAGSSPPGPAA